MAAAHANATFSWSPTFQTERTGPETTTPSGNRRAPQPLLATARTTRGWYSPELDRAVARDAIWRTSVGQRWAWSRCGRAAPNVASRIGASNPIAGCMKIGITLFVVFLLLGIALFVLFTLRGALGF